MKKTLVRSEMATRQGLDIGLQVFSVLAIAASVAITGGLMYLAAVTLRADDPVACDPARTQQLSPQDPSPAVIEKDFNRLAESSRDVSSQTRRFTGFRRGTTAARESLVEAAENRKTQLLEMMAQDPERAREMILRPKQRQALAEISRNCVEQEVRTSGTLTMLHGHEFADQNTDYTQYILETGQGEVVLHAEKDVLAQTPVGSNIEVEGWMIEQELLVASPSVDENSQEGGIVILSPPILPTPDPVTTHKLLVLMGDFNETNVRAPSVDGIDTIMANVDAYYNENSYGKAGWVWEAKDWVETGLSRGTTCNVFAATNALIAAADPTVDFSQYNNQNLAIFAPWLQMWTETTDPTCRWGGMASVTPRTYTTNEGTINMNTIWLKVPYNDQVDVEYVLNHELGHNLVGGGHANWNACPTGQTFSTNAVPCTSIEYEDPYDVMGAWYAPTLTAYHQAHFGGERKNIAGWLVPNNIRTITDFDTSGTFTLEPMERPGNGLKLLRIKRSSTEYTTIEYRQPTFAEGSPNMDNLFNTSSSPLPNVFNGALIRTVAGSPTQLLDATPGSANSNATPTLGVGQSLTDPKTGSTITVVSKNNDALTVTVTPPVIDYWAPPKPEVVNDGPGADIDTQSSTTTLSVNWPAVIDIGSGVTSYRYSISSAAQTLASDVDNGTSTSLQLTGLTLAAGETYYVEVRAIDAAGNASTNRISDGITISGSNPSPAATPPGGSTLLPLAEVYDGAGHLLTEADYTNITSVVTSWWYDDNDPSQVASYQYAIGTTAGGTDVAPYTDIGPNLYMSRWGLTLTPGTKYYVAVRIIGINGKATAPTVSDGITIDTTSPAAPAQVFDGSIIGVDQDVTASRSILAGNWSGVTDPSGVTYQYAIGRTSASPNYMSFTDRFTSTQAAQHDLIMANGDQYFIFARAIDRAGNIGSTSVSDGITIDINSDSVPPTIFVTSPTNGAVLQGAVNISATASDNVGIIGVQFQLDGVNLGDEDFESPYSLTWASGGSLNGSHTLRAIARDAAGHLTTATAVSITLNNIAFDDDPPFIVLNQPLTNANVSGTIQLRASAFDNIGVQQVVFYVDDVQVGLPDTSLPYNVAWDTRTVANGEHTVLATAIDAGGNLGTAPAVPITVTNAPTDILPPVVSMQNPLNAQIVNATVQLEAIATDDIGVVGVQFLLNGSVFGAEDTTSPYTTSWDTSQGADGLYTLSARARDASGKSTTSTSIGVTVQNIAPPPPPDVTLPVVSITSPVANALVAGRITITAEATDNIGISNVQFALAGHALGNQDTTLPYSVELDSTTHANGTYAVTALASDIAGNTNLASVNIRIENAIVTPPAPIPAPAPSVTPAPVSSPAPAAGGGSVVELVIPTTNRLVSGQRVPLRVVTDIARIQEVLFYRDGVKIGSDKTAPYILTWDSRTVRNGNYRIITKVRNTNGREWIKQVNIRTKNKLQTSFAEPKPNARVNKVILLKPTIYGGEKINNIEYFVDGKKLRTATKTQSSFAWNTRSVRTGLHSLKVVVTDALKNKATSIVSVSVRR